MSRKDKETIVFVVNVGCSSDGQLNNETVNNAKQLMKNVIEKKIFLDPKDEVGIILMGVDIGVNALQFDNIEDYHSIQVCSWNIVEMVLDITPSECLYKNWITGLRAGVNLMQKEAENAKRKTIVVIMDCPDTEISQQEMKDVAAIIIEEEISLLWVGTTMMLDLGREQRNDSEKMVQRLCRRVNGRHATFSELLPNVRFYGGKQPKPVGSCYDLEICDMRIPVTIYLYITENKPLPAWENVAKNIESDDPNEFKKVIKTKKMADYHKNEYEVEDIVRGYKYGRTFVPMSDDFMRDMKTSDTKKSLILYGFVPKDKVHLRDRCGDETHMILPSDGSETHFFALVKAMSDLNVVAIVRKVSFAKCDPKMTILYPQVDTDKPWCLLMIELMFKENLSVIEPRTYKSVYEQLKDDEWNAIDDLIDNMMLKDPTTDDEDKRTFEPGTIPTPDIQHIWNRLSHRALNPLNTDEDPPVHPPADYIMQLISSPTYLQTDDLDRCIDRVIQLFELNKEPAVDVPTVTTDQTPLISEKTKDSGYNTQITRENNDSPKQMDIDLDALCD